MHFMRHWDEIAATCLPLTPAEEALLHAASQGALCRLGDGNLPPEPAQPAREIRAPILRFLILGGDAAAPVAGEGLQLTGATITGELNLNFAKVAGITALRNCRFEKRPTARQAHFELLNLSGSVFPGLSAQGATVAGNVILRDCQSDRKVSFSGASIGRQFSATGAQFSARDDFALNLQGAVISGPVFLHPTLPDAQERVPAPFHAIGCVSLSRATMGALYAENITLEACEDSPNFQDVFRAPNMIVKGDVRLTGATVLGELKLEGARIEGNLDCEKAHFSNESGGHAFNGQRIRVAQALIWKGVKAGKGRVTLSGAHLGELDDDPGNWPGREALLMDGLTYDRIKGKVSTPPERREWLVNGSYFKGEFRPQPFTQYAKFLRATGHDDQARRVLVERETLVRRHERQELTGIMRIWRVFWDGTQRSVVGYGHEPFRSVRWLALLVLLTWLPADLAWQEGSMAPNAAPILVSDTWNSISAAAEAEGQNPAAAWSKVPPGKDWESFHALAYAVDVVIPIIDFGQTDAWAPSTEREAWGRFLWWWRWFMTTFGWIVTALGAAAITGIIRRE